MATAKLVVFMETDLNHSRVLSACRQSSSFMRLWWTPVRPSVRPPAAALALSGDASLLIRHVCIVGGIPAYRRASGCDFLIVYI